jgi:hypothetical protein
MTWRVSWQDYRGWRATDFEERRPSILWADFEDRTDAERELRLQRAAGMTACMHEWITNKRTRQRRQRVEMRELPLELTP